MPYQLFPPVKKAEYGSDVCCLKEIRGKAAASSAVLANLFRAMPTEYRPVHSLGEGFLYILGDGEPATAPLEAEGYTLCITQKGIGISAADENGLRYGVDTLCQILSQAGDTVECLQITDFPTVVNRGLMLDVSRGKVYTREYLLNLAEVLAKMRFNVLQLYMEHPFDFKKHPEICEGSDPVTEEDILALQAHCETLGIELQANLQCLGHCHRILTREQHMDLAESDMFWSLCTTSEKSLELIDNLFSEYLPLFHSKWVNICFDEPYDIGKGKSAHLGVEGSQLYVEFLVKVLALAGKYGKKVMMFGDVFMRHPEFLAQVPKDIRCIDWCYDPKPFYGTPEKFHEYGLDYWVSPGSGNWNTLFPRLDGSIRNINQLLSEGIAAGVGGLLFTDWNDHGGYTQPGAGYYSYGYASAVAWAGAPQSMAAYDRHIERVLDLPGYAAVIRSFADIYQLPPIWSKNRSECVMALFDEPIFGKAIRGPEPPDSLKAYDLNLPEGVEPVFERHSQHPLRPYFCIPDETCVQIRMLASQAKSIAEQLPECPVRDQFLYQADAFVLMTDKLALSRQILSRFAEGNVSIREYIQLEDKIRVLISRYVRLQLDFIRTWLQVAKVSEMEIFITYFAHIIERLDYLRDWMSLQREKIGRGEAPCEDFADYETAGYGTLPTY